MKETRILMGMPVTVDIIDPEATKTTMDTVFDYFKSIDERFSTYKSTSEITAINEKKLTLEQASPQMQLIFALAEETRRDSDGYFDIATPDGKLDPSGIVKGWAIWNAAKLLEERGFKNFYVDAGGDIQPHGMNAEGKPWRVGIRNPWTQTETVKAVAVKNNEGIATSGTYIRGFHIYNPKEERRPVKEIASLTVIGPNIYEADRFATAAFAMGIKGIEFIERLKGFEGYQIDTERTATMTSGFANYIAT